jgi:hypothetical protein
VDPRSQIKQRIVVLFAQKFFTKLSKIWGLDLGSRIQDPGHEIRDTILGIQDPGSKIRETRSGIRNIGPRKKPISDPDPRVKKAPDPGSGSVTMDK